MGFRTLLATFTLMLLRLSAFGGETERIALEAWPDTDGAIWHLTPNQFMSAHRSDGFVWVSTKMDAARSVDARLRFAGARVWEAIARFNNDTLKALSLSLYNRANAGELKEFEFEKLRSSVDQNLTEWAGSKGTPLKEQALATGITMQRKAWVKGPHRIDMIWSVTGRSRQQGVSVGRPEYIQVELSPFDPARDPRKEMISASITTPRFLTTLDMKMRVKRDANGDVMITGIPMVNQGVNGYCADAVAERVLRYYGNNVDEHQIAQLANTTTAAGTNPEVMIAALRRIADHLGVDIKVLNDFTYGDFQHLLRDYNSLARKSGKGQISYQEGERVDLIAIYKQMDARLFREARLSRKTPMEQFKAEVIKYVSAGVPIAWSVIVGKVEERPPIHGVGGHMRLITGYNERTSEILYSDTWGAGHEKKRMTLADAWTMTLGNYAIYPRGMRF